MMLMGLGVAPPAMEWPKTGVARAGENQKFFVRFFSKKRCFLA
jgi:hypothetical protein